HPGRRTGAVALRRAAPTARARPRRTRQTLRAGPRRPALRAGRAHRGPRGGGARPAAAGHHGARRRAPPVHRGARRPGGAAARRGHRRRRHALRTHGERTGVPGRALPGGGGERAVSVDLEAWRGVAADEDAERTAAESPDAAAVVRLRAASRRLLGSLLRPHRRLIALMVVLLLTQNAAGMAGPYLVKLGIDRGISPLAANGDAGVLVAVAVAFALAAAAEYVGKRGFLTLSGRIGQAVLLDLRKRVYDHFQRLSVGFHERYTSGRMISRLTSDMDSIAELVDG